MRSMPGGRAIVDDLDDRLAAILEELAPLDRRIVRTDPKRVEETLDEVRPALRELRSLIATRLPELLARNERNRAAAAVPERLDQLEKELAEVRRQLDAVAAGKRP